MSDSPDGLLKRRGDGRSHDTSRSAMMSDLWRSKGLHLPITFILNIDVDNSHQTKGSEDLFGSNGWRKDHFGGNDKKKELIARLSDVL